MSDSDSTAVVVTKLKCLYPDCGHEWVPRSDHLPKVCPRCKRYNWSRPPSKTKRVKGGVKDVRKPSAIDKFIRQKTK